MIKSISIAPGPAHMIAEQYHNGKHAYALLLEFEATIRSSIQVSVLREDLFWHYQLEGSSAISADPPLRPVLPLSIPRGSYVPYFAEVGTYEWVVPAGRSLVLILVVQLAWIKRYTASRFVQVGELIEAPASGLCAGDLQVIKGKHLRRLFDLQRIAFRPGFRQDIALYRSSADLFDYYAEEINIARQQPPRASTEDLLPEIIGFLEREVVRGDAPPVGELAERFGVRVRTLSRHFQHRFGETPGQYIQRIRMEEARRLLGDEHMPPAQVAHQLGYDYFRTFARAFHRHFGVNPGETHRRRLTPDQNCPTPPVR